MVAVVAAVTSVLLLAPAPANPSRMPAVAMIPSFATSVQLRGHGVARHELVGHLARERAGEALRLVVRDELRMLDVGLARDLCRRDSSGAHLYSSWIVST